MVRPVLIYVPRQMACYQPGAAVSRRHTEPGRTHLMVNFPQEYTPVTCRDFAPEFNPQIDQSPVRSCEPA